jgi:DNA-binding response OmpR family regulator
MSELVLIVDDDECVAINIQAYLEDEGFDVCVACSGEDALFLLEAYRPNFAIVDMRLPGMDGNQFIHQASMVQSQLQYIIHTGSIEYTLPDFLRSNSKVRRSVFFKPIVNMERFVTEMYS